MRGLSVAIASVEAAVNDPAGPITVSTTLADDGLPGFGATVLLMTMPEETARTLHLAVGRVLANLDAHRAGQRRRA